MPLADLKETDAAELDRIFSQARVVASKKVYKHFNELRRLAIEFNAKLFEARVYHRSRLRAEQGDDATAIAQRMSLGVVADKMRDSYKQIETAVRNEMSDGG
jgi:hypothetical protein